MCDFVQQGLIELMLVENDSFFNQESWFKTACKWSVFVRIKVKIEEKFYIIINMYKL